MEWKTIDSAPRHGVHILGWSREFGQRETYMRHYKEGTPGYLAYIHDQGPLHSGWDWSEPKCNWSHTWNPTHWMPLPEPPK